LAHDVWLIVVVTCADAGRGVKKIAANTAATDTSETRRQFESFLVTNVSFLSGCRRREVKLMSSSARILQME
jgi:hypothetical protein